MQRQEILARFESANLLIEPAALEQLIALADATAIVERAIQMASHSNAIVVTVQSILDATSATETGQRAQEVVVHAAPTFKPLARDIQSRLRIKEEKDVSNKSRCTGSLDDFVGYFRDRLKRMGSILKGRVSENGVTTVSALKSFTRGRAARLIGIVRERKETKNGHFIITLEDEEGTADALVPKDAPCVKAAGEIIPDEVIALDGYASDRFFIVKDILWPDLPLRDKKLTEEDFSIAFISDVHVGSKFFLDQQFERFLQFLNGEGTKEQQEAAGKVKYLLFAGDLVDGIGIYPEQEKELTLKDIYAQYEVVGDYLKKIPEYIEIVLAPGNHDAVRMAEPQPRLAEDLVKTFEGYRNVHFVGNPGYLDIDGLSTIMYHGCSLVPIISQLPHLAQGFTHPEKVAIELLKRRHLSPVYGDYPLVPEKRDYLVIDDVPDITHFGHIHHNGYADYRGTTIVNSGTWQSTTPFMKRMGFEPTPAQLPIYNAKTATLKVFNFSSAETIQP